MRDRLMLVAAVVMVWQVGRCRRHRTRLPPLSPALFAASLATGDGEAEEHKDPGGDLAAAQVRACLERWPEEAGLVFRTEAVATTAVSGS